MKALLVTSSITFVPNNYDALIVGLADCPQIAGLLVIDNRSWSLAAKAIGLGLLGAPRTAYHLLRNQLSFSYHKRYKAYTRRGKPVWKLPSVNCEEALSLVRNYQFDLVVNARTRCIYKKEFLNAPKLGCINIHHGLLPHQRGTMCDLWALTHGEPAGFSVHRMTEKIDAGDIISTVQVSSGNETSYPAYLAKASQMELAELVRLLAALKQNENLAGRPNVAPPNLVYRRNPNRAEILRMRKGDLSL